MRHIQRCGVWGLTALLMGTCFPTYAGESTTQIVISKAQVEAASIQTATLTSIPDNQNGILVLRGTAVAAPGAQVAVSLPEDALLTTLLQGNLIVVKAGQPVVRLSSPMFVQLQRDLVDASSAHALANRDLQRDQALFNDGLIPKVRLDRTRQAAYQSAAADQAARQRLKLLGVPASQISSMAAGRLATDWVVNAPRSGQIIGLESAVGDHIPAGKVLFSVLDPNALELRLFTDPEHAAQVHAGQRVTLEGCQQTGSVIGVGSGIEAGSQSVVVRATLKGDAGQSCVRVNQIVSAHVQLAHSGSRQVVATSARRFSVPSSALVFQSGKSWVFVQNDKGFQALSVKKVADADGKVVVELPGSASDALQNARIATTGIALIKAAWQGMGGAE